MSNCAYTKTYIPTHYLHMTMNVDGRNFFRGQELNYGMLFELHALTVFHFNWH